MQIHLLIPIPHPTYPGPDPPEIVYQYTTGYAMISDLKPPLATLAKLAKEANISKSQLSGGLAQFLGVND